MNLNGNHHHLQQEKQDAMYHFSNHPMYQNVYPQQCPMFLGHNKHSTVMGPPHNIQANLHNTQINVHNIHSTEHINQVNTHNTHPTHNFQSTHNIQSSAHNIQASAHTIQVSGHNNQSSPQNTQVIAHNTQVTTHNTQPIAYSIQAPAHNTQTTLHNVPITVYNPQVIAHNTQPIVHNTQSISHNTQPISQSTQVIALNTQPAHNTQATHNTLATHNTQTTHNTQHTTQNKLEVIQQNVIQVEHQDKENPKCLVKAEADSEKAASKTPDDTETPKCLVKVEVKAVPDKVLSKIEKKQKALGKSKNSVDTSHFTIEERLIAAVWVHERKNIKKSMRQLKHDFHQRFGRKAPAKNTLLGWERKLFTTGCLEDAPRTGRPVKRRSRVEEVAASIRSAPSLSLRARALALRVPTTTLHTILRRDLAVSQLPAPATTNGSKAPGPTSHHADKSPTKKNAKRAKPAKRKPESLAEQAAPSAAGPRDVFTDGMALSLC